MTQHGDVLVIGGGAIGLAIAWRLAQRGARVTVIDRGTMAGEASGNATGMLQSLDDADAPGALVDACVASQALYPGVAEELLALTGVDIEYGKTGVLRVAMDDEGVDAIRRLYAWHRTMAFDVEWVDGSALRDHEPALSLQARAALLERSSSWLNTSGLGRALARAAASAGVRLLPDHPLVAVERQGDHVAAVRAGAERIVADRYVIAAGAWSGEVGQAFGLTVPVFPVRGQLLSLDGGRPLLLRHAIYGQRARLVPWASGAMNVGSTTENVGFAREVTAQGIAQLLQAAMELVPALGARPLLRTWACFRSTTRDELPILGRAPDLANVFIATGHFRKGVQMTPVTAVLMADLLEGKPPSIPLHPFRPDRASLLGAALPV